jgi:dipeptidyl-peptidase-3
MKKILSVAMTSLLLYSCTGNKTKTPAQDDTFNYNVERFADLGVLRFRVPDWDSLSVRQKALVYCLNEAALWGRDILFDQNNRYNLAVRRTLETVYTNYGGDRTTADFLALETYLKRVWFSDGIHHHYGQEKFLPEFSKEFFASAVGALDPALVPTREGQSVEAFIAEITPVIFDPALYFKKVEQTAGVDVIATSANNYYGEDVSQHEAEQFYNKMKNPADPRPVAFGLNSRLVKENGRLTEKVWKLGGLYSPAIEKIVYWLDRAADYAENAQQKQVINLLAEYYRTGSLKTYDDYSIAWVEDTESTVDFVNGFTESYGDAIGLKASWEALVNFKDLEATAKTRIISENAAWFEQNSPVAPQYKKKEVKGISAKAITATILGGDCYPTTPIGINLPNSNWIRKEYGSKSVSITNITDAYDKAAAGSGFNDEFVCCDYEKDLIKRFGPETDNLHTDLHECLGHASGQLMPGVDQDALRVHGSTIEEARADLFGLYYIADPKMLELGLLTDPEAYKAEYYKYMMNGLLTQLSRIEPGKQIEEAHMRNRALIARWVLEKGAADRVVELKKTDAGKTFVVINDYTRLRMLIGQLLAEIQRIKSEGDFAAATALVENYAVNVDPDLHREIKTRYDALGIAPYKGFVNPVYEAVFDKASGKIIDVKVSYTEGFAQQMLRYSKDYSPLPTYN